MKAAQLATLRFISLLFLLPGLAGLVLSAMVSTHYMDTLPRTPAPDQLRMIPRGINGVVIYQTVEEDRKLNALEYSSVLVFTTGLILGLVYLEKWGSRQSEAAEASQPLAGHPL